MVDELIKKLDELVGTDDFEYEMDEIMGRIKAEGAGICRLSGRIKYRGQTPLI